MNANADISSADASASGQPGPGAADLRAGPPAGLAESPFLRASEGARTIFLVMLLAVFGPLAGGVVLFGWRAAAVAALCVASCALTERAYYRVTRTPSLLGRSHAVLTGVLLALTLPAYAPWYVPVTAGAFAILVGKAVFGGVGHFVWHPALVGRLAAAVLFTMPLTVPDSRFPNRQPVLDRAHLLGGDVLRSAVGVDNIPWNAQLAPLEADALLLTSPRHVLRGLTDPREPRYSALVYRPADAPFGKPAALLGIMPIQNLMWGTRPGGIGETVVVLLIVAGLYLVYRNYVKWQLPFAFAMAAWLTVAIAPLYFAGPNQTVRTQWLPLLSREGLAVAFTYANYQVLGGELALAVLLAAVEMTSRPVTTGGQVLFGVGCGVLAMVLQLYSTVPMPCFMAVLAMNTLTPTIDRIWRPRVFGTRRLAFLRRR